MQIGNQTAQNINNVEGNIGNFKQENNFGDMNITNIFDNLKISATSNIDELMKLIYNNNQIDKLLKDEFIITGNQLKQDIANIEVNSTNDTLLEKIKSFTKKFRDTAKNILSTEETVRNLIKFGTAIGGLLVAFIK